MDNANYQADLESFLRTGQKSNDGSYIWWRGLWLSNKVTPKEIYDMMIRSDIKFPTEFKLKGKEIRFEKLAGAHPYVVVKGKKIFMMRSTKNTKTKGVDFGQLKQVAGAMKGAMQGNDISGTVILTDPVQYFTLLCSAMFQLLYDRISDKRLQFIRQAKM